MISVWGSVFSQLTANPINTKSSPMANPSQSPPVSRIWLFRSMLKRLIEYVRPRLGCQPRFDLEETWLLTPAIRGQEGPRDTPLCADLLCADLSTQFLQCLDHLCGPLGYFVFPKGSLTGLEDHPQQNRILPSRHISAAEDFHRFEAAQFGELQAYDRPLQILAGYGV